MIIGIIMLAVMLVRLYGAASDVARRQSHSSLSDLLAVNISSPPSLVFPEHHVRSVSWVYLTVLHNSAFLIDCGFL